ncbi:MAG: hypothetical protein AB7I41_14855 [Candidatus Sericytochromatia bacterium]
MELFLGAFMIFPLIGLGFIFSSVTLYFTLKFFTIPQNPFGTALKVTVMAMILSFLASAVLGLLGMVIPVLPHLIGLVAPFAIYLYLLQKNYGLSLVSGLLVSLIQGLITLVIGGALLMGILLPLGLGRAVLGG